MYTYIVYSECARKHKTINDSLTTGKTRLTISLFTNLAYGLQIVSYRKKIFFTIVKILPDKITCKPRPTYYQILRQFYMSNTFNSSLDVNKQKPKTAGL